VNGSVAATFPFTMGRVPQFSSATRSSDKIAAQWFRGDHRDNLLQFFFIQSHSIRLPQES
jgi:hypothetical protein